MADARTHQLLQHPFRPPPTALNEVPIVAANLSTATIDNAPHQPGFSSFNFPTPSCSSIPSPSEASASVANSDQFEASHKGQENDEQVIELECLDNKLLEELLELQFPK
ncbi:hypothetical protein ACH5RR_010562 [Cinchona calisaya]|uniref:Uncharacterized protein n=1 Tax=Cinchona calisaya TaxID=153742 RepID=A0ABD3AJ96_9GENT